MKPKKTPTYTLCYRIPVRWFPWHPKKYRRILGLIILWIGLIKGTPWRDTVFRPSHASISNPVLSTTLYGVKTEIKCSSLLLSPKILQQMIQSKPYKSLANKLSSFKTNGRLIPSTQRSYRWFAQNMESLLTNLMSFKSSVNIFRHWLRGVPLKFSFLANITLSASLS